MSFTRSVCEDPIGKMSEKIVSLELALQQISEAKRQLCRNTAEAKSRIQCNISRQLEALRNREVWLLNQLDVVSSAKEEVLQQQSARLNKSLGVLQSTIEFPECGGDTQITRNLDRLDLGDLTPEETPYVSFKSDPTTLRDTIMNYGKIDSSSAPPLQSPFMAPEHPAPSLPRHFEDYNDAEHHILYKTVEEINRTNKQEPCVNVNIPKLSTRVEDWLLCPTKTTTKSGTDPKFSFPRLSNNLSDWLKSPATMETPRSTMPSKQGPVMPLDGLSTDASIKTWLHKIKQNPFEEEEDDYEFIEEMSDTRTQVSQSSLEQFPEPCDDDMNTDMWLYKGMGASAPQVTCPKFQLPSLPLDKWLLKPKDDNVDVGVPAMVDMSRYFTKITDEMDKWLASSLKGKTSDSGMDEDDELSMRLKPVVPTTLNLSWSFGSHMSRADNPWLLRSRSDTRSSSSISPVSSRRSSMSSVTSNKRICTYNRWLLNGGQSDATTTTNIPCPFMDKYNCNMKNVTWLKSEQKPSYVNKSCNPMANFQSEGIESYLWLKSSKSIATQPHDTQSPLKNVLESYKSTAQSDWLLKSGENLAEVKPPCFSRVFDKGDGYWLMRSSSPFPIIEDNVVEVEL